MHNDAVGHQRSALRRMRVGIVAWLVAMLAPVVATSAAIAIWEDASPEARSACLAIGIATTLLIGWLASSRLAATLENLSDLLLALREGDFGYRGREGRGGNPLSGLIATVNHLGDDLRSSRRQRAESTRFLGKTLVALQDPVFVVDDQNRIRLINPAGRRLLGAERARVVGRDLSALDIGEALNAPDNAVIDMRSVGAHGKWAVRRASWYSDGREHRLVMLRDLSVALADEERRAWQRLIRVLSHELNNSLAPIASLAGTLSSMVGPQTSDEAENDMRQGLEAIGRRADSLARFLAGYGKLARLPPLRVSAFRLDLCLMRLALLEGRMHIEVRSRSRITITGDEDQLTQAFINLLRNAVEAALPVGGGVRLDWTVDERFVHVMIEDDGIGLPDSDALFVPFFSTKPEGSGIGLSLVRLIVESHAGAVELAPRAFARGALATIRLPRESCR